MSTPLKAPTHRGCISQREQICTHAQGVAINTPHISTVQVGRVLFALQCALETALGRQAICGDLTKRVAS